MDDYFFDEYYEESDWFDLENELLYECEKEELNLDMDYKTFKQLDGECKMGYLYNKIRDLYSYISTIQDVV